MFFSSCSVQAVEDRGVARDALDLAVLERDQAIGPRRLDDLDDIGDRLLQGLDGRRTLGDADLPVREVFEAS